MDLRRLSSSRLLVPTFLIGAVVLGAVTVLGGSWLMLAAVGAGSVGLLVLRSPFAGLLAVIFFLPLERLGAYETAFGTVRGSQVIALLTLFFWLLHVLRRKNEALRPNPIFMPLAAFLAVNIISLTIAPNFSHALITLLLTAFTIIVALLIPQIVVTHRQLNRVIVVMAVSATLVSLFGIFQFLGDIVGLPTTITGLRDLYTKDVFGFPRIQSTALEPLYFANYLLLPIGVLYALFLSRQTSRSRWVMFSLLALLGANFVLTLSRGGYFGGAVMLFIITAVGFRDFFRARTVLPLLIGIALVGFVVMTALNFGDVGGGLHIETFTQHIQNVFYGASYNERVETYDQAKQIFWSSPLVGIGPGSFGPSVAEHPLVAPEGGWRIVNNEPLELLAETGLAGFAAVLIACLIIIFRTIKALRISGNARTKAVLLGLFGAWCGVLAQYQTFSILYIMHVWVLVGLLLAAQNLLLYGESHE